MLAVALLLAAAGARAEPVALTICYEYGCKVQAKINFDEVVFVKVGEMLRTADDAVSERYAIAAAVARLYVEAGKQTPIWRDRGGDTNDEGEGSMDCIDHAANTTTFLKLMEARGLLRFHSVGEPVKRGIFAEHWAAQIVEQKSRAVYTVDSWFYDFGMPAIVMSIFDWRAGRRPPGIMAGFR
ncbi:MAG: hypothetical protein JWN73_4916 [Betaproteobacteria bacterium]|nr:hypothetical protein [Betaproteobacteria bacterium]